MTQGDLRVNNIIDQHEQEKENLDDITVYTRHKGVSTPNKSFKDDAKEKLLATIGILVAVVIVLGGMYYK